MPKTKSRAKSSSKATAKSSKAKAAPKPAVEEASLPDEDTPTPVQSERDFVQVRVADVDVADVKPGSGKGEVGPVVHEGMWVRLSTHDSIPEEHQGKLAVVIDSPWKSAPIGADDVLHGYTFDDREDFVLRTRDEADARVTIKASDAEDAFMGVAQMRGNLEQHA